MRDRIVGVIMAAGLCLYSCSPGTSEKDILPAKSFMFEPLSPEVTGIRFANQLQHTERLNTYTYRNFYNGAGTGVGDINNDGLVDIYIAGNQVPNKLYLNKGDFTFEDITEKAGVACEGVWSTGVSLADVDGDGLLDIYVCKSGPPEGPNRNNELFINNGDLTFTERAAEYGIDDKGLSNHAVFLDYDLDGDLDMYLLNNSMRSVGIYDLREGQREIRDPDGGNKLYRNDGQRFTDVSAQASIYGSAIGFGLGVTAADVNKDGWPDIFISNDFFERDYLYINQHDGTFREALETYMNEISMGSMGADIADLTNDGYPEIYVTEMLPATMERVKTKTVFEDWDKYQSNVRNGYYHQFTRNVLQLNNGPVPGRENEVSFSEISRLTGTEATDWSWGALIFDADNDGWKDIFVANGIYKDLTDQDYINFYSNSELHLARGRQDSTMLTSLIDKIPSHPLDNHFYLNEGGLSFRNAIQESGLEGPGFSNGAAYADLDNDGDLDLLVNNINAPFSIYRNLTAENGSGNSLQIELTGPGANSAAFGTQAYAYSHGNVRFAEQQPVKGYMSTMDSRLHLGLGDDTSIDSLLVIWPDRSVTRLENVSSGQLTLNYKSANRSEPPLPAPGVRPAWKPAAVSGLDTVTHQENDFIDFNRDRLLFEMYSNEGPPAASSDLNGDGRQDFLLGGSAGYPLRLFLQREDGSFRSAGQLAFTADRASEDTGITLSDVDGDGDMDILVASGGNEFAYGDVRWLDRLYLNDGQGNFSRDHDFNQAHGSRKSTAFILTLDFDLDGDPDLLIGDRMQPFRYGIPVGATLLENDGFGKFRDVTAALAPDLRKAGLLTGGVVVQKARERPEIFLTGEWMQPLRVYWDGESFISERLPAPAGLYKSLAAADVNRDGQVDLVLGNFGQNTRFKLSEEHPLTLFVGDFDRNGALEHILSMYQGDSLYPLSLLQDLTKQMPAVRKKFQTFDAYKDATVTEVLNVNEADVRLEATSLQSGLLLSQPDGSWHWQPLPVEAQIAPVHAILIHDLDGDEIMDLLLAGNQHKAKPELGIYNASYGVVLKGDGRGKFESVPVRSSGIWSRGEVRSIIKLYVMGELHLLVLRNNNAIKIFKRND